MRRWRNRDQQRAVPPPSVRRPAGLGGHLGHRWARRRGHAALRRRGRARPVHLITAGGTATRIGGARARGRRTRVVRSGGPALVSLRARRRRRTSSRQADHDPHVRSPCRRSGRAPHGRLHRSSAGRPRWARAGGTVRRRARGRHAGAAHHCGGRCVRLRRRHWHSGSAAAERRAPANRGRAQAASHHQAGGSLPRAVR